MDDNELIEWLLEQAELCLSDYPRPDLAEKYEAIAARLKALERTGLCQVIDERDAAEELADEMYVIVTGERPTWSNRYGRDEAKADIEARIKSMEDALRWYQQQCAELAIPIDVENRAEVNEARAEISDDAFMALQLDGGERARAILDAEREVE